jgi:hypothetical protein
LIPPTTPPVTTPTARPTRHLSAELLELSQTLGDQHLTLRELMERLEGRVYTLLLVLLSLPFCLPVSIPGLSTPFGVVIVLLGARFALRQQPWLPKRLLDMRVPAKFVPNVIGVGGKLLRQIERLLHPRLPQLFEQPSVYALAGATVCACGALLLLPLPIPFTNFFPAITIVLIALAVSERDGVMLAGGGVMFGVTIAYFALIFLGGAGAVAWLEGHFGGLFDPNDEKGLAP